MWAVTPSGWLVHRTNRTFARLHHRRRRRAARGRRRRRIARRALPRRPAEDVPEPDDVREVGLPVGPVLDCGVVDPGKHGVRHGAARGRGRQERRHPARRVGPARGQRGRDDGPDQRRRSGARSGRSFDAWPNHREPAAGDRVAVAGGGAAGGMALRVALPLAAAGRPLAPGRVQAPAATTVGQSRCLCSSGDNGAEVVFDVMGAAAAPERS